MGYGKDMNYILNILGTTGLITLIVFLCRKYISEYITTGIRHRYERSLEELRAELKREYDAHIAGVQAELTRQNNEVHSRLLHELEVLREKELSGFKDKILIYRLAIEIFSELYVDLQKTFRAKALSPEIIDKYNYGWTRCYGYLSMLAPQYVIDAFDELNDYILNILNGRSPMQPWGVTRKYVLNFLNSIRKDIGLMEPPIEYKGKL